MGKHHHLRHMTMEPTREQLAGWIADATQGNVDEFIWNVARLAYAAGADAELEACCEWACCEWPGGHLESGIELRAARRPKPLSLKQRALKALNEVDVPFPATLDPIYEALESLPDD